MTTPTAPPLLTVDAGKKPCSNAVRHLPKPLLSQLHHRFAVELQALVWSDVDRNDPKTIRAPLTVPLCGTEHDTVHVVMRLLIAGKPVQRTAYPRFARKLAEAGFAEYEAAKADPAGWKQTP